MTLAAPDPTAAQPPALSFSLAAPEETDRLGQLLATCLRPGDVVLLGGSVGAGKTHLARALIRARLGAGEDVPSPTFTLVQTYGADGVEIWHADLYRLGHPDEIAELGLEQAFDTAICLIEWPDRLGALAPQGALHLHLSAPPDGEGRIAGLSGGRPGLLDRIATLWAGA
ncbi:tRNA (adenosine(37)-N6)-threonylcarbamoyltransferase complex ATPase subunit type 1 TsaE [Szabonella alba]|uniref:tRNA threonylcarbamoyladenosine biosynthesis protein TsaE n=1 Tax=Szabonella alba TaxID=2804194 RepID=A0A8K0V759_9RHOB|nr:tRNA (adenosine(37)-N6)-threonylcarbamoyltransferase complex ATPase subunit type 1 TsaE [Szabonella alba]MBL4916613.1 tRNA (adenosine(37)-N6)-threonylcarbamoyltransferase complex ATPase subunit type 1 TsaE [Szabonella alba]